jgi:NAD(P)H dehydrogenase (quinone)
MKTLIIYAHPDNDSHSKITLQLVKEKLESKKEKYEILDLYAMNFNPVLSKEEIYSKTIMPDVTLIRQKIDESNHLIFIYPIWWNTMPAILKGFIDRVFSAGYAFQYYNGIPKGLLVGKNATIFVSTGSNKLITFLFLGNRFKKAMVKDILGFCGIKTKVYHIGEALVLNEVQKTRIKNNVNKALG